MDGEIKKVTGAENKGVYGESDRREWRGRGQGQRREAMTNSAIRPAVFFREKMQTFFVFPVSKDFFTTSSLFGERHSFVVEDSSQI